VIVAKSSHSPSKVDKTSSFIQTVFICFHETLVLTGKGNLQAITKRKGVLMVAVNLLPFEK
jgi:hypothetical protein